MASQRNNIPHRAGVGLKACHYHDILNGEQSVGRPPDHPHVGWPHVGWFEIHPENFMGAGGAPHAYLTKFRENFPLSLHGVGLSIGGAGALDIDHLDRLKALVDRYQPALFSEHLAWSTHRSGHKAGFFNDLLAAPYTSETLDVVCDHIDQVQTHLKRPMLLENPSTYVLFDESTFDEVDFIAEISRRTGCGLLLDVNNVYVSCTNHQWNATDYINRFPARLVEEIHLAGHAEDTDDAGQRLLIDSHDRQVTDDVWDLYALALRRTGPVATLIEWDSDIPEWSDLCAEAEKADTIMDRIFKSHDNRPGSTRHVA